MTVYICKVYDTSEDEGFSVYENKDELIEHIQNDIGEYVGVFLRQGCTNLKLEHHDQMMFWRLEDIGGEYFREWEIIPTLLHQDRTKNPI